MIFASLLLSQVNSKCIDQFVEPIAVVIPAANPVFMKTSILVKNESESRRLTNPYIFIEGIG